MCMSKSLQCVSLLGYCSFLEKFEEEVKGMGMRLGRNLDFKGSPITKK